MNFEIVFSDNGKGLSADATLLKEHLNDLGHGVAAREPSRFRPRVIGEWSHSSKARRLGIERAPEQAVRAVGTCIRRASGNRSRVRIFLEAVAAGDLLSGSRRVLIPNPEWLSWHEEWALPLMDLIACKTRSAEHRFAQERLPTFFLGFTSRDRSRTARSGVPGWDGNRHPSLASDEESPMRDPSWASGEFSSRSALHVASGGTQKGTAELVSVWRRHPEWPELTVLAGRARSSLTGASNIRILSEWVSDVELERLMQSCPIHVCCSISEGFGHTILESMSCGALVLTTDLAPMNELVDEGRGLLVPPLSVEPMNWGRKAILDPEALAAGIEQALLMSDDEIRSLGRNARAWYLENHRAFRSRMASFVARVTGLDSGWQPADGPPPT